MRFCKCLVETWRNIKRKGWQIIHGSCELYNKACSIFSTSVDQTWVEYCNSKQNDKCVLLDKDWDLLWSPDICNI